MFQSSNPFRSVVLRHEDYRLLITHRNLKHVLPREESLSGDVMALPAYPVALLPFLADIQRGIHVNQHWFGTMPEGKLLKFVPIPTYFSQLIGNHWYTLIKRIGDTLPGDLVRLFKRRPLVISPIYLLPDVVMRNPFKRYNITTEYLAYYSNIDSDVNFFNISNSDTNCDTQILFFNLSGSLFTNFKKHRFNT